MLKRWWKFALVITLALSLTSCGKKAPLQQQADYGFGYCDGSLGQFDVYVIPLDAGQYQLSVIPVSVNSGDIVSLTIANQQNLAYRPVANQVVVYPNQEINGGNLTDGDLMNYNILAITPYDPSGQPWTSQQAAYDAICNLPLPNDPTQGGYYGVRSTSLKPRTSR
jgi:hypothetical protein